MTITVSLAQLAGYPRYAAAYQSRYRLRTRPRHFPKLGTPHLDGRLAAPVAVFPLQVLLISERYLTAGPSQRPRIAHANRVSRNPQQMAKEHTPTLVSMQSLRSLINGRDIRAYECLGNLSRDRQLRVEGSSRLWELESRLVGLDTSR